jgi:hexulose-6-phosphate isomerase
MYQVKNIIMQRRSFIKNTILASGALSLPFTGNAGSVVSPMPVATSAYKNSIMWRTIGMKGSVLEICKAVKEAGFHGFEAYGKLDRKEVSDASQATGLPVTAVTCDTHREKPLSHPDATVRQEGIEGVIKNLEDAKIYGADAILLIPAFVSDNRPYDEAWELSTESVKKLVPVAEKMKIMICFENVWNNFLLSPLEACRYVDQFNSPYIKFYFDIGNIVPYGWPEQWIRILGDRIGRVHIKEYSTKIANEKGKSAGFNAPLTEGTINWAKVMEVLRNNYKHTWLTTEINFKTAEELKDLSNRFDKILNM